MSVVGVLLAAGESSRMQRPKALLPWGDSATLLEYQVEQMRDGGCDLVLVVWGATPEVEAAAKAAGALTVENSRWREGRASSTRAGAHAAPSAAEAIVVVSVDQPMPAAILRGLLDKLETNREAIHVPVYDGKRGHPVVLPGKYLADLRAVKEETLGLHELIEAHPPAEVEVEDAIVTADINTPEDYVRLHEQVFGTKPVIGG